MRRETVKRDTAAKVLSWPQKIGLTVLVGACGYLSYRWGWRTSLAVVTALCEVFYFVFVAFKLVLAVASYLAPRLRCGRLPAEDDPDLPMFTILLPMAKEKRHVLEALLESIANLHYPKHLLQVIPCIDWDDTRLLRMFGVIPGADPSEMVELPGYVTPALRLEGTPRTKPAAVDFGLALAEGMYTLIYDAEDSPDPLQLLRAVRDFRNAAPDVACLQARLLFWNIEQGLHGWRGWTSALLTRMYYVEYTVHFEFVLRGMARLGLVPPLGGTSNIFRTDVLREIRISTDELVRGGIPRAVAEQMVAAWDPWNVTEDADVGPWLARYGYRIEMMADSYTIEEAQRRASKVVPQKTRWGKGYGQTGAVHARHPIRASRQMGLWPYLSYELMMLGTPLSLMINPIFWAMTVAYFGTHSAFIQSLFPPVIFYIGATTAVVGNFMLFYLQITACLRDQEHGLVKYMLALGPWWLMTSYAMWKGVLQLAFPKVRFHWALSEHGHYDEHTSKRGVRRRHDVMSTRS